MGNHLHNFWGFVIILLTIFKKKILSTDSCRQDFRFSLIFGGVQKDMVFFL